MSNITPRTRADGLGWLEEEGRVRGQALSCFVLALVKCTRIYFSSANDAPCLLAHSKHQSWTVYSVLLYSSVDLPKARAFTSSTKPVPDAGRVKGLQASTKLALRMRNRIGDSGEPCGMPVFVGKASVL